MYFVIYKSSDSKYYFTIKSDNHEIVATSETYLTKWSAEKKRSIPSKVELPQIHSSLT